MTYELDEVKAAARWLVSDPDAAEAFSSLEAVIRLGPKLPVKLTGAAAELNPLLYAYRDDPGLYETVMEWVQKKRAEAGLAPVGLQPPTGFDKTQYMREFMQQKRIRERRAVGIENMLRSERDRLKGRTRMDFLTNVVARWKAERDTMLDAAREKIGGQLSKPQMQQVLENFWKMVDARLDEQEASANRKMRGL